MTRARTIVIAIVAVVVLVAAGVYGYVLFVKDDAPAALSTGDLEQALSDGSGAPATSTGPSSPPVTDGTTDPSAAPRPTSSPTTIALPAASDASGTWTINSDSTLGYRVSEVLGGVDTEGAGRTNQVTGTLTIDGTRATAAEFTVDMASVTSDSDRRDNQFRTRIMSTDEFPTATFVLTAPIDFGTVPTDGQTVTATATGDLTLRGVTRSVTFDVEARLADGRVGVLGSIPVLFSDYGIPDPSNPFAVVEDQGLLEFVLVFDRS